MDYVEWAEIYFKSIDILKKEIVSMKTSANRISIDKKRKGADFKEDVIVVGKNKLSESLPLILSIDNKVWVVVESSRDKIKEVVLAWDKISKKANITLVFVDLAKNGKWALSPYIHAIVSSDVEKSLLSIMENM